MKLSKLGVLAFLVVLASAVSFADTINDPKVIIHGVGGGGGVANPCGSHNCQPVGVNFSFNVPKSGSGVLYFTNASGKTWTSLALIEHGVPAADISCSQTFYLSCTTKTLKNGSVEILLSGLRGPNPRKGIAPGQNFLIQFACVEKSCWPGGLHFTAHAGTGTGTTPEPGTVALLMTGIGTMFSRRKAWKNRFNL